MAKEFRPQYTFTEDRLIELKQLFPEAFEDGVFNLDTLKTLIGDYSTDSNAKEHFGLNWVGKQDARKIAAKPPTGTLKPCPGEGVNEDNTENIFIEGENLEVLKILRKSYMGQIKMIYIDPPYNTGNDFIYNDTFADSTEDYLRKTGEKSDEGLLVSNPKSSGKYHANWLSFMYPRLRLAKDLLKEDGVIFISISDEELANLIMVMNEIFFEQNYLGNFIWRKKEGGGQTDDYFVTEHEYIIVYKKSDLFQWQDKQEESDVSGFPEKDSKGNFKLVKLEKWGSAARKEDRPTMHFPIIAPNGEKVIPIAPDGSLGRWRVGKKTMDKLIKDELVYWKEVDNKHKAYEKIYFDENIGKKIKTRSILFKTGGTSEGTNKLTELFGVKDVFDNPKPLNLLKTFIKYNTTENDIILDFFAGSASIGHAIFELIEDEKIKRKFLLVQLNEKVKENSVAKSLGYNFISDLSIDRIKKVIYSKNKEEGFKVFKQYNSTIYKWQEFIPEQDGSIPDLFSKLELAYKNPIQDGVTTQDFITEVILQEGFPLTAKQVEVASGIFKISHEWVPYTLYATMLYSFKNTDFAKLNLQETDHFVCLDKAFEGNDALKQQLDNQCKLFTI
jgi:adenine-specific DNA-methyltransferase